MTPQRETLVRRGYRVEGGELWKRSKQILGPRVVIRKRHYSTRRIIHKLLTGEEAPTRGRQNRAVVKDHVREPLIRELLQAADASPETHRTICRRAKLAQDTLRHWKRGRYSPNLVPFINLARALGYRLKLEKIDETGV